jgi:L-seryl-tRNA(Ser) seleniumtransferase
MATQTESKSELFRRLPSVDELTRTPAVTALAARDGRVVVTEAARAVLEHLRGTIQKGDLDAAGVDRAVRDLPWSVEHELQQQVGLSLRLVINATGVILHTNLGRAPLAADALTNVQRTAAGYSNLEFDLASGERGKRDIHVDRWFRRLFRGPSGDDAEREVATLVVNNNAAAVWLALNTIAAGGEVIVSRGELVEIGGSFRIPDVMAQSNGILREVGTTNRTRIADYANAITDKTRALLRVHRSNFQITGFTEQPALRELVALARERGLPLIEDLGSGALFDLSLVGIQGEDGVLDSLGAGVDVITYSGDKLLGGPQAGLLSGRPELIARMRKNSLFRALRVDKLTYAALEATLLAYVKQDYEAIPALRMLRSTKAVVRERAEQLAGDVERAGTLHLEVVDGESVVGGGAAPSAVLPTALLAITSSRCNADELQARLRAASPPIIARVEDNRVLLDLRTVFLEQDAIVAATLRAIASEKA